VLHDSAANSLGWQEAIEKLGGPNAIHKLKHYLELPDSLAPNRDEAIRLLAECGTDAIPILIRELSHKDSMHAIYALARMKQEAAPVIPQVVAVLRNAPDWLSRAAAADALGEIGNTTEPVKTVLIQALGDTNQDVRRQAARALGKLGVAVPGTPITAQSRGDCGRPGELLLCWSFLPPQPRRRRPSPQG
jgi:HEAT repeat protein